MITVLHYAPGFRSGGIESRLLDWYRNINREQVRFVLVKLNNEDDTAYLKEFDSLGGRWYNLPAFTLNYYFSFLKELKKIFKKEKIDVVHVHDVSSGFLVLREAKKRGIKCRILHSRTTSYLPNEKNIFVKTLFRKITPLYANYYFGCSIEAGKWGCGQGKDITVIKNGIQANLFDFDDKKRELLRKNLGVSDKYVVGHIGRISPQKNIPFLLEVFDELVKTSNKYSLLLVGKGDNNIIKSYYGERGLPSNVIMVGDKKNVWDYYMSMDVFCSPSLYEGFGTTAIESQATGLPTLLSEGFPKVVEITSFVKRLPISKTSIKRWVENIIELCGKRYPNEGLNAVKENGYDAPDVANFLCDFYYKHIE